MIKLISSIIFLVFSGSSILMATDCQQVIIPIKNKSNPIVYFTTESELEIIPATKLTRKIIKDFFNGNTPHVALQCDKGLQLPFNFSIKGFLSANPRQALTITAQETCYLRFVDEEFLLSTDLIEWQSIKTFFDLVIGVNVDVAKLIPHLKLDIELHHNQ